MSRDVEIVFRGVQREQWLRTITLARGNVESHDDVTKINIRLQDIPVNGMEPMHVVTLACLIDSYISAGKEVELFADSVLLDFLSGDLKLDSYFGDVTHIDARSGTIFNLWKILPAEAIMYSSSLSQYFEREIFSGYDISFFKTILDELYANVADHSKSDGIAYSYIVLDERAQKLYIAFCDFGIGIPVALKQANVLPRETRQVIMFATRNGVTSRSNPHNAGYGLDTVIGCAGGQPLRIVSNNELYYCEKNEMREETYVLDFDFKGTLIYFALDMSDLETDDIVMAAIL